MSKPREQRPKVEKPRREEVEQPSLKKERVKSTARKTEDRAPRHQEQSEQTPRTKSKSVKRGDSIVAENKLNQEADAPRQIFGLGGEMALAAATSKKAQ
jgi:hypothetical protein